MYDYMRLDSQPAKCRCVPANVGGYVQQCQHRVPQICDPGRSAWTAVCHDLALYTAVMCPIRCPFVVRFDSGLSSSSPSSSSLLSVVLWLLVIFVGYIAF